MKNIVGYYFNMVKYLSLVLLLLVGVLASKAPYPTCSSPKVQLNDLPISLYETQTFHLNEIFHGYNLDFSIPTKPGHVTLREKLTLLNETKVSQPGLRSYHMAHPGNTWGSDIVTLSVENDKTIVRWGTVSQNSTSVPIPTKSIELTKDPKIQCFDTVWFRQEELILIDCVN